MLLRHHHRLLRALGLFLIFGVSVFGAVVGKAATEYVEGDVIVTFKATATLDVAKAALNKKSMTFARHFDLLSSKRKRQTGLVRHATKTTAQLIAELKNDPSVETVEPNYIRHVNAIPTDSRFVEMWSLQNTGQAVNGITGTANADVKFVAARAMARSPSDEVVVAVIDTGVDYNHPELAANMWTNSTEIMGNAIDDDGNGYKDDIHGYDFVGATGDPSDSGYHGTHVAGTIAAVGDNQAGTIGVNERARIMALRVSSNGNTINSAAAIEALQYVVMMKGRGVNVVAINASYGGGGDSIAESAAIQAAGNAGVIFCAAAGNDSANNDTTSTYPASYRLANMIVVAATDQNDALASYSDYGAATVDLAAPGSNILSTKPSTVTFQAGGTTYTSDPLTFSGVTTGLTGNIIDCGIGDAGQFPVAVSGNIALIARGTLTFSVKVANAKAAGATAAIIYNNVTPGTFLGTLQTAGGWIPTRAISQVDGLAIKAALPKTGAIVVTGNYQFLDGTSMATPHVAGAVAFAAMNDPVETMPQRRQRIISSVDVKAGLVGKCITSGRLNLLRVVDANLDGVADWYAAVLLQTPTITTASPLNHGTMGLAYSQTLAVTNGTAPYAFALSGGALPIGLDLSGAGVISGIPTATGTSSFTVTVTAAGGFNSSKVFSITVKSPYASWSEGAFTIAEQADSATSGPMADPNHNGLANLIEFALNRDPKGTDTTAPIATSVETDSGTGERFLTVTYTRRIAASGVSCYIDVSSDLNTWNTGSGYTHEEPAMDDGNGITQTVTVRVLSPVNQPGRVFTRLRVTQP